MDKGKLVNLVEGVSSIRGLELPSKEKRQIIEDYIEVALNEIVTSYEWDFVTDEASTVTVKDQAEYTLEGNNSDCRDVLNVRYNTNLDLLLKRSAIDMDEFLHLRTHSTTNMWYPSGRDDGFPQITIVATPGAAGKTIKYRYRRSNVQLSEFPNEFSYVLVSGIAKRLIPDFTPIFSQDLKKMIDHYSGVGGESTPARLDPTAIRRNNERSKLFRYGG